MFVDLLFLLILMKLFFLNFYYLIFSFLTGNFACDLEGKLWPECRISYLFKLLRCFLAIQEKIERETPNLICEDLTHCRSWKEIKNLAFCKASKLSSILPSNYELYYVSTAYKTQSVHEWSKFVFAFFNEETKKHTFIKLCVAVDRAQKAWFDDRCPLDFCSEFGEEKRGGLIDFI